MSSTVLSSPRSQALQGHIEAMQADPAFRRGDSNLRIAIRFLDDCKDHGISEALATAYPAAHVHNASELGKAIWPSIYRHFPAALRHHAAVDGAKAPSANVIPRLVEAAHHLATPDMTTENAAKAAGLAPGILSMWGLSRGAPQRSAANSKSDPKVQGRGGPGK
jgi:hypothetical protein